jgi:hypothetical protein
VGGGSATPYRVVYSRYVLTFQRYLLLPSVSIFSCFQVLGVGVELSAYFCHCELPMCLVKRNSTKTFREWRSNPINS